MRDEFTTADTASLPVVTFNPLTLADAGAYSCLIEVTSPYINNPISETTGQELLRFTSTYNAARMMQAGPKLRLLVQALGKPY